MGGPAEDAAHDGGRQAAPRCRCACTRLCGYATGPRTISSRGQQRGHCEHRLVGAARTPRMAGRWAALCAVECAAVGAATAQAVAGRGVAARCCRSVVVEVVKGRAGPRSIGRVRVRHVEMGCALARLLDLLLLLLPVNSGQIEAAPVQW